MRLTNCAHFGINNKIGNIQIIKEEVIEIPEGIVIIATGPLTSNRLADEISNLTGEDKLHFYDAAAPIITKESIDFNIAFWGDRYGKGDSNYINLPMNKDEYELFYNELISAKVVDTKEFEKRDFFEGCMPIEIMAKRGIDTIRFGPLKPVGLTDPRTGNKPYAIVQLRQDDSLGNLFNLVGFQTNLKFTEQKRVFSLIPGLGNADFVRHGVMHRNTFINSPNLLDNTYNLKFNNNIFFAGQITGVEGYVESISSGYVAGINAANKFLIENNIGGATSRPQLENIVFPDITMIGCLAKYISSENKNFQPMNANFGILPELEEKIRDKQERYNMLANRALEEIDNMSKILR